MKNSRDSVLFLTEWPARIDAGVRGTYLKTCLTVRGERFSHCRAFHLCSAAERKDTGTMTVTRRAWGHVRPRGRTLWDVVTVTVTV
jgi:hypothetical protein